MHATRLSRGLGAVLGTAAGGCIAAAIVLLVVGRDASVLGGLWFPRGFNLPVATSLVVMGVVLTRRRPENPVAWAILLAGSLAGIQSVFTELAINHAATPSSPVGRWSALMTESLWPGIVVGLAYALGRFPGDRRRRGHRLLIGLALLAWVNMTAAEVLVDGPFQNATVYENPVGLVGPGLEQSGLVFLPFVALVATAGVLTVTGWRGATGIERLQYRWVAVFSAPFLLSMAILPFTVESQDVQWHDPSVLLSTVGLVLVPVGITVAIVRYRLYDLDRLVSRTVTYALLSALVAATWVVVALAPTLVLGAGVAVSDTAVALATVAALAVASPLRRRVQDTVDRRLYRSRYDARRAVEQLGTALADEVDVLTVTERVTATVISTLEPRTVAVWTPEAPEGPT